MRGEGQHVGDLVDAKVGSSPHARGGPHRLDLVIPGVRLIPACAGRANGRSSTCRSGWAHPRMRGEGVPVDRGALIPRGSSPHARGGQGVLQALRGLGGAHPRMRGEGLSCAVFFRPSSGSSPHARGGRLRPINPGVIQRLIPACAGRATVPHGVKVASAAHPRMRGEGVCRDHAVSGRSGSSPHARGGRPSGG